MPVRGAVVWLILLSGLLAAVFAPAARADDCAGSPPAAVLKLPAPLDQWGKIECTPFGHVLTAHDGWVWNHPATASTVFVPAQMGTGDPAPVGNRIYFTEIRLTKSAAGTSGKAYQAFRTVFPKDGGKPTDYRIDLKSVSGSAMELHILDFGGKDKSGNRWGIWCPDGDCKPQSLFMILDMRGRP